MARNIVICCDGTGNKFGRRNTNVLKVCECLDRNADQLVYYDPGVGTMGDQRALTTFKRALGRLMGNAIGWGLIENVQEAYDFLAWHHRPGDRVFMFGFSRGAYTVRALAALLHMYGLTGAGTGGLTPYITEMLADDPGDSPAAGATTGGPGHVPSRWEIAASFKKHFGRPITIDFVGVFDTVASVGWLWSPLRLPYTSANKSVLRVRHALSIDERRGFFLPNLYKPAPNDPESLRKLSGDVKEVWFPGVHSDVGGGYERAEQGLAQVAFQWMIREAGADGLRIDKARYDRVLGEKYAAPSAAADQHWSLTPGWWPLEVIPKVGRRQGSDHRWHATLIMNLFRRRAIPDGATMHASVGERWKSRPDWRPPNLKDPAGYPVEA